MKTPLTTGLRAIAAAVMLLCLLPFPRVADAAGPPSQASKVLGMTAVDARNKRLGVVSDLLVDLEKAQIVGLKVGHNTAEGMVHDVFAWPSVQLGEDKVVVRGSPIAQEAPETQSLAKILQAPLKDAEGKPAGQIQDLMVAFDDAHVASFVLTFDPKWLDMAAPAAVPLTSLARQDDGFLVKFKSSDVRPAGQKEPSAPPPPPLVNLARLTQVDGAAPNLEAARRVLAARFINPSGDVVGKTEDVVVDMADGKPQFVVASFKADWVAAGWLVILPVRPVVPDKEGQPAMRTQLNDINHAFLFEAKSWPDFSNPAVRAAVHAKIDHL